MNNTRRKTIADISKRMQEAVEEALAPFKDEIEEVRDEEQEYLDNMPESMQYGEKGEKAQEAIAALDEALDLLDDINAEDVIDSLNTASE